MIIEKPLAEIELEDLETLADEEIQEGKEIEYKEYLNLDNESHKEKLLGEVTSFANARGGDLIVGIPDDQGTPEKIAGFPIGNIDKIIERWGNTIRREADPKLPPSLVDIKSLYIEDDRYVLIVRVKKSWNPPHRVRYNDKFYDRSPSGKFDLETAEIRRQILETERFTQELKKFRSESISEFLNSETPLPVSPGPKAVLHLVPSSAFSVESNIDRKSASAGSKIAPRLLSRQPVTGGYTDNYTLDSVIVHQGVYEDGVHEYVRTFKNGIIEMLTSQLFRQLSTGALVLDLSWLKESLMNTFPHQLAYLEGVIEVFSHRDHGTSWIVSTFIIGDRNDETET